MNISVLKKCLEELQKESFRKDYVIGMLETLIELNHEVILPHTPFVPIFSEKHLFADVQPQTPFPQNLGAPSDEAQILDAKARARVDTIRTLAEKSTELS